MDYGSILGVVGAVGTGFGGYVGGRLTGRSATTQIAHDTVDMLQAQIEVLQQNKDQRELEMLDLLQRVAVLEGLVTQRADVEELSNRVSLVKDTVDRIAVRVGA